MRICPKCGLKTEALVCPVDGSQTVDVAQYAALQRDPFVGQVFEERYRIDGLLGQGGFGAVYRGEQLAMGRAVAIKLLHAEYADDLKEVARFQREARSIAALRHPNIVQVYDFGQTPDGYLYLVMECLEGRTLKHIVRDEAPLPLDRMIDYLTQALDGLAEAHARGVIHRDLKPENIFCATIGRREGVIKILDFGIAKILDDSQASMTLTGKGMAVGSPRYMSPEQARAQPVTPQTDLYLIGLIAYELLTGRSVFERESPTDYLLAHIRDAPPLPVVDGVRITGPLVDLILQCLEKEPASRPKSAEALMAALDGCRDTGLEDVGVVTGRLEVDDQETETLDLKNLTPPNPSAPTARASSAPPPVGRRPVSRSVMPPPPPPPISAGAGRPPPPVRGGRPVTGGHPPLVVIAAVLSLLAVLTMAFVGYNLWRGDQASRIQPTTAQEAPVNSASDPGEGVRCETSGECPPGETCIDGACE